MTVEDRLKSELESHITVIQETASRCATAISRITSSILECFRRGNKLLLCGNGGSAADAQHVAAEFINRYRFDRAALPALALTTDSSILTCIGNDSSYEYVFSRQVEALAVKGDLLVGISTSGRSVNVLNALEAARTKSVATIGFTGANGSETLGRICDQCLVVPSADTGRIQEVHEFVWHVICGTVEAELFVERAS